MFENSPTFQRLAPQSEKVIRIHLGYVPDMAVDSKREQRGMRWAILGAVVLHLLFFMVRIPIKSAERPEWTAPERPVYAIQQLRFERPQPRPQQAIPPPRAARRIPVPDPTPDDPEPIVPEVLELPVPEFDIVDSGIDDFFIPDGPPASGPAAEQAFRVGGDVTPPIKLTGDTPSYTEEARQGRVQGVVILEAIIDVLGQVADIRVLKGLPLGLTETAIQATREWRFRPAMRGGDPVPVFYNLTVRFSLQ